MKRMNRTPGFCQHGCFKTEFGNADELLNEWWVFLAHLQTRVSQQPCEVDIEPWLGKWSHTEKMKGEGVRKNYSKDPGILDTILLLQGEE